MTKKRLLEILESVDNDADIYFAVTSKNIRFEYADGIYVVDVMNEKDKQNELTLVLHF